MLPEDVSKTLALRDSLYQMAWGFRVSQTLYVAAKLGIMDVLGEGAKSASAIADAVSAHEPSLRRLLRALTTVDSLEIDEQGRFVATERGKLLQTDHPLSIRNSLLFAGASFIWQPWGMIEQAIMTGVPAFDQLYGESFFDYIGQRPEAATIFNAAMTQSTSSDLAAILEAYDFSSFTKIIDVGGGQGSLLKRILEQYPYINGVLYDLPTLGETAAALKASAVAARCTFVGGDMFYSIPAGGDAYILKWIIHDWGDAEAVQILRNCRQAITAQGKLILVELVIDPATVPDEAKWLDLDMLVLLTGRERTELEFRDLYAAAGFRLTRVIPAGKFSIIEGIPT